MYSLLQARERHCKGPGMTSAKLHFLGPPARSTRGPEGAESQKGRSITVIILIVQARANTDLTILQKTIPDPSFSQSPTPLPMHAKTNAISLSPPPSLCHTTFHPLHQILLYPHRSPYDDTTPFILGEQSS